MRDCRLSAIQSAYPWAIERLSVRYLGGYSVKVFGGSVVHYERRVRLIYLTYIDGLEDVSSWTVGSMRVEDIKDEWVRLTKAPIHRLGCFLWQSEGVEPIIRIGSGRS